MILLYLIGILCSLVLFAPNIVPGFVKWPIALLVVLLVVFFFNLCKKDTIYITHDTKKKLHNHGLFNPLIMYVASSIYVLGFTLIITNLMENHVTDFVGQFNEIIALFEFDLSNSLCCGLIFVVSSILIYFIRNSFKNNASDSSLKFRAFWYFLLTTIALLVGIFNLDSFSKFDMYNYLANDYNIYVYFGIIGLVVLIDLIAKLIVHCSRKRRARKLAEPKPKKVKKEKIVKPIKRIKKATFLGTLFKLIVTGGFFVGSMYCLDTFYPGYAESIGKLPFAITLGVCLYLFHLMDLLRICIYRRACKAKRSRFLLFVYDLFTLCSLYQFISIILIVISTIFSINQLNIAQIVIDFAYIGLAIFVIQYLIIVIATTSKAKHLYLAAKQGSLIGEEVVKEKKVKEKKVKAVKKGKKYRKPTFWGFMLRLVLLGLIYAALFYAMITYLPDVDFFGSYLGYVIIGVLVFFLILDTIGAAVIYRAGLGKTSKFLIFLYAILLLAYFGGVVFGFYYYMNGYFQLLSDMMYIYILAGAFAFSYLCSVIGLASRAKRIRRKALAALETETLEVAIEEEHENTLVEEKPLTKKELKKARKQAKKEAKLAKKAAKRAKVIAKERKRTEKKLAKKEAKINKKIAKLEKKLAKKEAKIAKKQAKKEAKIAKKQAKKEAKLAKKQAKKNPSVVEG